MTQRIFDVNNPKEIFDLFPDNVIRIEKTDREDEKNIIILDNDCRDYTHIKINWRDKIKITRPVDESQWIGKLCWFTGSGATCEYIGVLKAIVKNRSDKYQKENGGFYSYCRPVCRDEVQFVKDAETKEALKVAIDALSKIETFDCNDKGAIEVIAGMASIANGALYEITSITKGQDND